MRHMLVLLFISAALSCFVCGCKTTAQTTQPDNGRTSVDWPGVYTGTLPCADCEGIQTVLRLDRDLSYLLQTKFVGKSDSVRESRGTFEWNEQGSKITLQGVDPYGGPSHFLVGENRLIQLDLQGDRIQGELSDRYVLTKSDGEITEKYWKLIRIQGVDVVWREANRREPHIILKAEGNRVNGNGGCNTLSGIYQLKDTNGITFSEIVSTRMACPNMEIETQLLQVLNTAESYVVHGDTLLLNGAGSAESLASFAVVYLR